MRRVIEAVPGMRGCITDSIGTGIWRQRAPGPVLSEICVKRGLRACRGDLRGLTGGADLSPLCAGFFFRLGTDANWNRVKVPGRSLNCAVGGSSLGTNCREAVQVRVQPDPQIEPLLLAKGGAGGMARECAATRLVDGRGVVL